LAKKRLAPQGNEAGGIEVLRMDSPKAHDAVYLSNVRVA
jgi:hypothetical protein